MTKFAARFTLLLTRWIKHTEKKANKNQKSFHQNQNKPKTIYMEAGRGRGSRQKDRKG